ncbi:MAG: type II toxin-antitoxin system RelE/ParE family toxin [Methyloglobulus sp.]|nr:type II toxin-antitoxin system RelE/ParE family toxin [Methyloglobulus sp.]
MKKIPVVFYENASGHQPVREWLKELDPDDRRVIGEDIATVEYGWPIGMPTCRPLGQGIGEVRSTLPSHKIARVLFGIVEGHMVLLHGFIKKSQKTPDGDLQLARKRLKEIDT